MEAGRLLDHLRYIIYSCVDVQVGLNGKHTIDVRINGTLVEFEEQLLQHFNGVSLQRHSGSSKYSVTFSSGVLLTIEGQRDLLQLILLVPVSYKRKIIF